ncbi:L,D-transpeptidase family protein [Labrys wisconsinensis]|uniref:Murein L,D-transpeptidase YcbB/YkuD n=1 Tax=Labrys wisconsinensis TaxID=425677 RepID=A0ABU0JBB0_9HYPH|nr:L,D-transpeptidase family protein [Labrys wisconsinensis]MDQ0471561.1 murein L,D-transpeptidase YcbB/YkuD [Labrys wisconsinensis]
MSDISRRSLLTGLAAGAAATVLARGASAQEVVLGQMEMRERYDSGARSISIAKSASPTFSPYTVQATENAIQQYAQIAAQGGWQPVSGNGRLKLGTRSPDVVSLRQRLIVTGDLAPSLAGSDIFDSYVDGAVRRFQARHGILASGVIGPTSRAAMAIPVDVRQKQLDLNLVRLRAMGGNLGARYVMMNIPATELEAVNNGVVESRHNTVIGKPDRQSPVMSTFVQNINFNPFWTVPVSIIKKDLIPKMQEEPTYLADHHIRIYNPQGQEIQADQVNWNSDDATRMRFTQDPGFGNSLGTVRINIANQYGVYMHDTPYKSVFGSEYRFDSSGCARVQNVRDLCAWILQGTPYTRDKIDEVIRSGARQDAQPVAKLPVYWTYITAWATPEGMVQFRDDVYDKDGYQSLSVVTKEDEG